MIDFRSSPYGFKVQVVFYEFAMQTYYKKAVNKIHLVGITGS